MSWRAFSKEWELEILRGTLRWNLQEISLKEEALIANFKAQKHLVESKVSELLHQLHWKGAISMA